MDAKKTVIHIFLIILINISCSRLNNPKERNIILFSNNTDSVIYAIKEMNNILDSAKIKEYFFYAIDREALYVANNLNKSQRIGSIKDTLLDESILLSFLDLDKRKRFINIVLYLHSNHIDRCDYENNNFIYLYRSNIYMADRQKDLMRYVVLVNSIKDIDLNKYKVLNNKNNLFLLVDKDAEIWEN